MTRTLTLLALLATGAALTACGSGEKPSRASATSSPIPESTEAPSKPAKKGPKSVDTDGDGIADPVTVKGRVGDALILNGAGLNDDPADHRKTRVKVALQGVRGPFPGFDVAKGRELIGVELRFTNLGRLRYDDAQPHAQLTVAGGESGKQTNLIPLGGKNPCVNPSLKLRKGQSKTACLAFDVPKADKPRALEFVSDDGYGDTGLWRLP
jgi:hypothetical protein